MAEIEILTETEAARSWVFEVRIFDAGRRHDYRLTLGWADYDLWCRGRLAPQQVARAVMAFLLSREPASAILPTFDCSVVRRYFPEVDKEIGQFLAG